MIDPEDYIEFSGDLDFEQEERDYCDNGWSELLSGESYDPDDFDEVILEQDMAGLGYEVEGMVPGAELMGLALALADEIATEKKLGLDEDTDRENWAAAMKMEALKNAPKTMEKKLRKFEQHVADICGGTKPLKIG